MLEERGAEDFGEFSVGVAAEGVHLPEAVLGGDVALGEEEIGLGGGFNVGDAVGISADGDGRGEAGEMEVAVEGGEGGFFRGAQPEDACGCGD